MIEENKYANGQRKTSYEGQILTHYFDTGGIKAQGKLINGLMEGEWLFNKKEGYKWQVGHFLKGEKQGSWVRYKADGSVQTKQMFKRGKQIK
jgi:antitoxin component YwqK of YwqJK toxin-antitoxin module